MHLTYESNDFKNDQLMQGDVLKRTPALDALLKEVHPHFYSHPKNHYFMVLTQSCDLVPRLKGGGCKAPYIAIAPVRSIDLVVERQLSQFPTVDVKAELPVLGLKSKTKIIEFLRRLLNNNEPGYFYLDAADTPLGADSVAFLNLSIAVKSDLHLVTCVSAKILQLTDTFQAKLGWLVGQMFSRVGTPDWDPAELSKKVSSIVDDTAIWIDDTKIGDVETSYLALGVSKDHVLSSAEITRTLSKVPTKKQRVIARAAEILRDALGEGEASTAEKLRKRLESDAALTALLKTS
jgi:hypothetical protein